MPEHDGNALSSRPLFLRWALFNSVAAVVLAMLVVTGFFSGVHGAPLLITGVIAAVGVVASAFAGRLTWRADKILAGRFDQRWKLKGILHDADHVFHSIWLAQVLGITGALMGYREQTKLAANTADASAAIHAVFAALGNGLTPTLAGVLVSLLFFLEHRLLEHALGNLV